MVNSMDRRNSVDRDVFGQDYQACVEENRAPSDRSLFYVKWARAIAHTAVQPEPNHADHPQEKAAKANGFRDRVIPGEVERRFSERIEGVRAEREQRYRDGRGAQAGVCPKCEDAIDLCGHNDPFDCDFAFDSDDWAKSNPPVSSAMLSAIRGKCKKSKRNFNAAWKPRSSLFQYSYIPSFQFFPLDKVDRGL